jgi:glycerol-3-phosphate dehydrogenase (NAD(P)+)
MRERRPPNNGDKGFQVSDSAQQEMKYQRVAVIGAGSWGTALALLLSTKGHDVSLWAHRSQHVSAMKVNGENTAYLPGFPLPSSLFITDDIADAISGRAYIVMVVPSHGFRSVFNSMTSLLAVDAVLVSATKGIENDTLLTMTDVMAEELQRAGIVNAADRTGVLSGPSFAREVAQKLPTAVTIASRNPETAKRFQKLFFTERFRTYFSTDVTGVEIGGALKNVVAIAAGISDGLGYGTNTRAALITRGLAEIARLGVHLGANPLTFAGLAGLGDLVLTCTGDLSRNRQVGMKLGQGKTLAVILNEMQMVAEGVKTTRSAWQLARKHGVDMPILEQVYKVLYEESSCITAVSLLLGRDLREEIDIPQE